MKTQILVAIAMLSFLAFAPISTGIVTHDGEVLPGTPNDYWLLQLKDPSLASYEGGLNGLERTKPLQGQRLDLDSPAARAYAAHLEQQQAQVKDHLRSRAPAIQVIREYSITLNGLAVKLNGASPVELWRAPSVKQVSYPRVFDPMMNISPGLVGAPTLWAAVGGQSNAGASVKIGIIDTGINQTHPFFIPAGFTAPAGFPKCDARNSAVGIPDTSCNFTTGKVIVAKVFQTLTNVDARDQRGHGSHVSGTAAGVSGTCAPFVGCTLSGIAPRAWLGNYNVFPGTGVFPLGGSAFEHDVAMAVEEAVRDGMDVLNLSLGGRPMPNDLLSSVVNSAVDAGLVVAVAAGNAGPGPQTVSSPGVAEKAITAGASTNRHFVGIPVTISSGTFGAALGSFNNFGLVTATYTTTLPANGCTAITTILTSQIALIDRGVCTFTTKIRNAQTAGAIGVIIRNNVAGDPIAMGHDGTSPFPTIPAVMASNANGAAMGSSGTATVDGTNPQEFVTANFDIIAGFSSRGPPPLEDPSGNSASSVHNKIKPDVTAPGVNVYSSITGGCGSTGCFAFFQGTSMATPHVAGSAALLIQQNPSWSPEEVKSALVNTAKRPVGSHRTAAPLNNPMDRGGGRIDLAAASMVSGTLSGVSASFGTLPNNVGWVRRATFTLTDVSGAAQAYTITVSCAVCGPTITLSTGALALGPGASGSFTVTLTLPSNQATGDYRGDIVLTGGTVTLRIPYWVRVDQPTGGPRGAI